MRCLKEDSKRLPKAKVQCRPVLLKFKARTPFRHFNILSTGRERWATTSLTSITIRFSSGPEPMHLKQGHSKRISLRGFNLWSRYTWILIHLLPSKTEIMWRAWNQNRWKPLHCTPHNINRVPLRLRASHRILNRASGSTQPALR